MSILKLYHTENMEVKTQLKEASESSIVGQKKVRTYFWFIGRCTLLMAVEVFGALIGQSRGPSGHCLLEPVEVVALVDYALAIDTQLELCSDGRQAININRRNRVDVEDLALATRITQASLSVILEEIVKSSAYPQRMSTM